MKKIFWTSIFWIGIVVLFWLYIKIFNQNLWDSIWNIIYKSNVDMVVEVDTWDNNVIFDQLTAINTEVDIIADKVIETKQMAEENKLNPMWVNEPAAVKLYYFNEKEDKKLDPAQQVNINSILPVSRTITATNDIIRETINLLLEWALTNDEVRQGFTTEFPSQQFHLVNYQLSTNWVLTIEFNEVPWFTSWWSARMLILSNSISKTLLQFPQVKKVLFTPETLFQP